MLRRPVESDLRPAIRMVNVTFWRLPQRRDLVRHWSQELPVDAPLVRAHWRRSSAMSSARIAKSRFIRLLTIARQGHAKHDPKRSLNR